MRVLVLGASGFIGSAVTARLLADGYIVLAASRGRGPVGLATVERLHLDVSRATAIGDWLTPLEGVDAVVNCAGTLQDAPGDSTHGVHVAGIAALYEACERVGIRRVIHVSAVGVDRETPTVFPLPNWQPKKTSCLATSIG